VYMGAASLTVRRDQTPGDGIPSYPRGGHCCAHCTRWAPASCFSAASITKRRSVAMPPLRPLRRGPLDSHCSVASAAPMSYSDVGAIDPVGCWIKPSPTVLVTSALVATQRSVVEPLRGGWLPALSVASLWLPQMWWSGETSLCLPSTCRYVAPPRAARNCRDVACARVARGSGLGRPHTGGTLGGEVPANVSLPSSGGEGRSRTLRHNRCFSGTPYVLVAGANRVFSFEKKSCSVY
jgi:hypothetical protein